MILLFCGKISKKGTFWEITILGHIRSNVPETVQQLRKTFGSKSNHALMSKNSFQEIPIS